jgi:hypothetical protein
LAYSLRVSSKKLEASSNHPDRCDRRVAASGPASQLLPVDAVQPSGPVPGMGAQVAPYLNDVERVEAG